MKGFKRKKVLVLGGMGFIGSNLAIRLVALDAHVTIVDSMLPQYGGNLINIEPVKNHCQINFSDIRDTYSLEYLVKDADIIFSMAGQTSHIESMTDPMTDLDINCRSQLALLESVRKHNPKAKIVYASTRQVYGRPQYLPVDEKHPVAPCDVNGVNKVAAENYYTLYSNVYKMNCVSLRLTNTYGPRQHLRGDKQGFAGIFIRKAISQEPIQLFGGGKFLRDFNYIDDVVEAFLLAASHSSLSGNVYNLGAEERYPIVEFVKMLKTLTGVEYKSIPFPPSHKVIDIGDYYADFSRFKKETGWSPNVPLVEGLERTVAYFRPCRNAYW